MSNAFRDKLLTLNIGRRTKDKVQEWKSDDGERHKATTDELNNTPLLVWKFWDNFHQTTTSTTMTL